jgi:hypothetical protein
VAAVERMLEAGAAHSSAADQDGNLPMHYAAIATEQDGSSSEVELSSGGGGGLLGCCRRPAAYEQGGVEGAQSRVGQVCRGAGRLPARGAAWRAAAAAATCGLTAPAPAARGVAGRAVISRNLLACICR